MKKFLYLLIAITSSIATAQLEEPQVKLAVLGPELSIEGLNARHIRKIQTKIQRMVSRQGIVSTDYINDFIIYPEFEIYVDDATEGTYGNIYDVEAELTLKAQNIKTGTMIAAPFPFELKGASRDSRNDAITKAIGKIKTDTPEVADFIEGIKKKIIAHYKNNCASICNKAVKLINIGAAEEAISLLCSVPKDLSGGCYAQVEELLERAYSSYNAEQCLDVINEAQIAIKDQKVDYAKALLNLIPSNASCYEQAQNILNGLQSSHKPAQNSPPKSGEVKSQLKSRKEKVVDKVSATKSKEDDKELLCAKRLRTDCD